MRSAIYGMCRCVHTGSRRISRCQRACVPLVPVGRVSQRLARPIALLGILANRWLLVWKSTYEEKRSKWPLVRLDIKDDDASRKEEEENENI